MKKLLLYCMLIVTLTTCKKAPLEEFFFLVSVGNVEVIDKYNLAARLKQNPNSTLYKALPNKKVKIVSIVYNTLDPKGQPILASGAIFYPVADIDYERLGTILALHYTYGADYEVPSQKMAVTEGLFSLFGYIVVAPDYIGYGASRDKVHPYYDVGSTGQAAADMLLAAKEYFASISRKVAHKVTVMGYSQGGQASLAFLKFAETTPLYQDAFIIDQVFAGGGAYDLIKSYDTFVAKDYSSQPVTIPLLILGMNYGDSLDLDLSQMFAEPLLSHYEDWILSKKYTTDEVSAMMGETKLTKIMAPQAFDTNNPNTKKFRGALWNNSLIVYGKIKDWKPRAKVTLLHATKDTIVPYENTESAYEAFLMSGCDVKKVDIPGKDHKEAGQDFYTYVMLHLLV
ncbi:MAG: alpha/beta fold hydrolase [Bacteroidetes bacterium]|nr:alpha/beta fold hydrolase [Bacteroidota bacterium]